MPETQGIFGFSSVNWGATPNHEVQPLKKKTPDQILAANSIMYAAQMQACSGLK